MKKANNSETQSATDLARPRELQDYRKLFVMNLLARLLHRYPGLSFKYDGQQLTVDDKIEITVDQGENPNTQEYLPEFSVTARFGIGSTWKHNKHYGKVDVSTSAEFTMAAMESAIAIFRDIEVHLKTTCQIVNTK
jgi:hypothetical protein